MSTNYAALAQAIEQNVHRQVQAIFLSGSKLNHLATAQTTDTDLYVIVNNTLADQFKHPFKIKEKHQFQFDDQTYDLKIVDVVHTYQLIRKENLNFVEIFMRKPLYIKPDDILFKLLATPKYQGAIVTMDVNHLYQSILGIGGHLAKQPFAQIMQQPKDVKQLILAFKGCSYSQNLLHFLTQPTMQRTSQPPLNVQVGELPLIEGITLRTLKQAIGQPDRLTPDQGVQIMHHLQQQLTTVKAAYQHIAQNCMSQVQAFPHALLLQLFQLTYLQNVNHDFRQVAPELYHILIQRKEV